MSKLTECPKSINTLSSAVPEQGDVVRREDGGLFVYTDQDNWLQLTKGGSVMDTGTHWAVRELEPWILTPVNACIKVIDDD